MTNADNGERDDDRPGARLRSMIRNWPDTDAPSQPPDPNWTDTDDPSVHPLWTERSKRREAVRRKRITRRELAVANGGTYPGPITHGASGYNNYGCRCDECMVAHSASQSTAQARRNAATAANGGIAPTDTHGTSTYHNWGCRCDVCCADDRAYWAELRARRKARAG